MRTYVAKIWLVFVVTLLSSCQSASPPPIVEITLDSPDPEEIVEIRSLEVVPVIKWASANHFRVRVFLSENHKPSVTGNVFMISEVKFFLGGGGSWFRDRFSLKLSAKGYWQGNKDDEGYFVADAFVSYPHGFEFKPNDPKARAWLEDQMRELWHQVLRDIRDQTRARF